mgnify:CR=1 FL=1
MSSVPEETPRGSQDGDDEEQKMDSDDEEKSEGELDRAEVSTRGLNKGVGKDK